MKRDEQKTPQYQELVPFGFRLATVLVITGLGLVIVGCDGQRGKFATTGTAGWPFSNPVGSIEIVSGVENGSDDASDRHLLYLLILTPGLQGGETGGSSDYGTYVTTLIDSWDTDKGPFSVSVSWDRKRDVVIIGSREFKRSVGDVFVVTVSTNGTVSGEQLPSLSTPSDASGLLHYVQQQLPNDKRFSAIRLRHP
jgi:hypothetical protein